MAFSGTQTTRHGLYGGARQPYGAFAGKTEAVGAGPDAPIIARVRIEPHAARARIEPGAARTRLEPVITVERV